MSIAVSLILAPKHMYFIKSQLHLVIELNEVGIGPESNLNFSLLKITSLHITQRSYEHKIIQ